MRGDRTARFADRAQAGRMLAEALADYHRPEPVVLALPRGGVPVAAQVAEHLDAGLDVLLVHKLGCPGNREFAIGAIGEAGVRFVDEDLRRRLGVDDAALARVIAHKEVELSRRLAAYRSGRPRLDLRGRNVIVVDDGVATGSTALAAISVARRAGAAHVTFAAPVAAADAVHRLRQVADDVVCLAMPDPFFAVGAHFDAFTQVTDAQVVATLAALADTDRPHPGPGSLAMIGAPEPVVVAADGLLLPGLLSVPASPRGIVVFAHGSGSSRLSPRNAEVAATLAAGGFATVLFDLLTEQEAADRANVFDVELLAARLRAVAGWVAGRAGLTDLPLGYFGASTGAAAALVADAQDPGVAAAIVSRGGRPDLAGDRLAAVTAPTLLVVGGRDEVVLDLNRQAQRQLRCANELAVVPGATHLFDEPGALARAAELARSWFARHLAAAGAGPPNATQPR